MRLLRLGAAAALLTGLALGGASPARAAGSSDVSVLHGIPGLTVDVYAGDTKLLSDFKPGDLAGPVKLAEGTYDLKVFPAGQGPSGTPAVQATGVRVPAGANLTVAAHLGADGKPVLTPFVNDVGKVAPGKARLVVRHVAAAPAVDVRAGGQPVFRDLVNPKEAKADVPAGTVSADVVLAGTGTVAIGPADVTLAEGTSTIVYAWGSAQDKSLKLAVQTIKGLHSAPAGVPSGTGGLLDDGLPGWVVAATLAALAAAVVSRRRLVAARG